MKERPILFSGAMVRAILAGQKTVTRRIVDATATGTLVNVGRHTFDVGYHRDMVLARCPYGVAGDRLWARETFARGVLGCEEQGGISYRADHRDPKGDGPANPMTWTPSIFMRRTESRITLDVTAVRVERLQDITEEEARAEGVLPMSRPPRAKGSPFRDGFAALWDEINGKRARWSSNPWVWVVAFPRFGYTADVAEREATKAVAMPQGDTGWMAPLPE
jgi:hypothetical protein